MLKCYVTVKLYTVLIVIKQYSVVAKPSLYIPCLIDIIRVILPLISDVYLESENEWWWW